MAKSFYFYHWHRFIFFTPNLYFDIFFRLAGLDLTAFISFSAVLFSGILSALLSALFSANLACVASRVRV